MATIDYLILAEKDSQAQAYAEGLFDQGNPSGKVLRGGLGGTNISSVLHGTVKIVRFQGHILQLLYPEEQDPKYSNLDEGIELTPGKNGASETKYKTYKEMVDIYPVTLNLNHLNYDFSNNPKHPASDHEAYMNKLIFNNIVRIFKQNTVRNVIVATDFDAEGEEIFQLFRKEAYKKDRIVLNFESGNIYRAVPNELTPEKIRETFQISHLKSYKDFEKTVMYKLHNQGFTRSIVDYEYGLSFTVFMHYVEDQMNAGYGKYGRLKNSILGVVYQAEIKHDNFKPHSAWRVDMKLADGSLLKGTNHALPGMPTGLVFKDRNDASKIVNSGQLPLQTEVRDDVRKKATKSPQLYSRNELIIDALKIKDTDWSPVLQKLYEIEHFLSYIRSDIRYINPAEYEVLQQLGQTAPVQSLLQQAIKENLTKNNWTKDDTNFNFMKPADKRYVDSSKVEAHYAIIPTKKVPVAEELAKLDPLERDAYGLDLFRTMAMFAGLSEYEEHKMTAVKGMFESTRKKIISQGWRLLTSDFAQTDVISPAGVQTVQYVVTEVPAKQPPLFNKGTLLKLMKSNDWGTSATRDKTVSELMYKGKDQPKWKVPALNKTKDGLRIDGKLRAVIGKALVEGWINLGLTGSLQKQLNDSETSVDSLKIIKTFRQITSSIKDDILKKV